MGDTTPAELMEVMAQTTVEWTDRRGEITFGWGARCELLADDSALILHAEAEDIARLGRTQDVISRNLERFARKDGLRLTWNPPA
jgi:hypothetical protein